MHGSNNQLGPAHSIDFCCHEGVAGRLWHMVEALPTISWYPPRPIDEDKKECIRGALLAEAFITTNAQDPYWFGKRVRTSR